MLVLSRKLHETIDIGDDIHITVLRIGPDVVRLGIEAPRGVKVHRREITEIIAKEREQQERQEADD